jgi:hypothetical protein
MNASTAKVVTEAGIVTVLNLAIPVKKPEGIVVIEAGASKLIALILEHPIKDEMPKLVVAAGTVKEVKPAQPEKVLIPNVFTDDGSTIEVNVLS